MANPTGTDEVKAKRRSASQWAVAWRRFRRNKAGVFGLAIVIAIVSVGVLGGFFAPYPARWQIMELGASRQAPSWKHPFGTSNMGHDIFSEVIHGTKYTLYVAVLVTLITIAISIVIGSIAGFYGGWIDNILMRITEVFLVFPALLFILVLLRIFMLTTSGDPTWQIPVIGLEVPTGLSIVAIVLAIFSWSGNARMIRGEFLRVRELEFIEAERALGASNMRIIFRHVLPNILSSVIVVSSLTIAYAILVEAAVSFLGFGDPNTVTWGLILNENYVDVQRVWWGEIFPGLAVLFAVFGFNLLGDGLADALNPRLRD